jgi:hypothetical protein
MKANNKINQIDFHLKTVLISNKKTFQSNHKKEEKLIKYPLKY